MDKGFIQENVTLMMMMLFIHGIQYNSFFKLCALDDFSKILTYDEVPNKWNEMVKVSQQKASHSS